MSVFAIADLHLSLGTDKPMDDFSGWSYYVERLADNWRAVVGEQDTVVIAGDISWGMTLKEARADFAFLHQLPGTKLLFKGNHDYWWTTRRKMDAFFEECGFSSLRVVHNDAVAVGDIAVCGTRGWFYEVDEDTEANRKILLREAGRLQTSIQAAKATGLEPVVFLHYPPIYADTVCQEMFDVLRQEGIRRCYYGHIHGQGIRRACIGQVEGIQLQLISGDHLSFMPLKIS